MAKWAEQLTELAPTTIYAYLVHDAAQVLRPLNAAGDAVCWARERQGEREAPYARD
jgi:hypothetical protein